ncbi:12937_t:CDS:2, partial [Gigaspora margarita]
MNKIKKEGLSASFYEEVIDLTIDSFSESDFPIIDLDNLGINVTNVDEDFQLIENTTDDEKFSETPIINYFTEELAIRDIWFSAVPIEYPATSNKGIQYLMEGRGGSNKINCPYLNCHIKKVVYKCTSTKICEYTENEIKNSSHCE